MLRKISFLVLLFITAQEICAQTNELPKKEPLYVNIFIAADKTIYVETQKTYFQDVDKAVSEIVRKMPFSIDQKLIYRIFADENLKHGFIMDVNEKMLSGYRDAHQTQKYLLDTVELNIDGSNWFEAIDLKALNAN
jgi:biopolymer transport protein ExbD